MPQTETFHYDWHIKLSKYSTLRYEDSNRTAWKEKAIGEFVRNDRFCCLRKPNKVTISIRKTYEIPLA